MDSITFDPRVGKYVPTGEQLAAIGDLVRTTLAQGQHSVIAQTMIGPIRQTAVYRSWSDDLFAHRQVPFNERPRVALQSYVAQAWYTTPSGTAFYTRPGRRYVRPEATMIQAGANIGWYDLEAAGWNLMEDHIQQAGEELARKRDALAKAALDAFFTTYSTHSVNSTGGVLSKTAVNTVLKAALTAGFPITRAVVSPVRAMDMADWTNSANTMWGNLPERYAEDVIRQGYITNYGGIQWITRDWCPSTHVYFTGDPAANGQFHFEFGQARVDTAQDIDTATTRTVWRETHGYMIAGGMALYRVVITS